MGQSPARLLASIIVVAFAVGCGSAGQPGASDGPRDTSTDGSTTDLAKGDVAPTDADVDAPTADASTDDVPAVDAQVDEAATTPDAPNEDATDGDVAPDLAAEVAGDGAVEHADGPNGVDAAGGADGHVVTDASGDLADASGDLADASGLVATLFLSHARNNAIYRFALRPGSDPVLDATISATAVEGLAMSPAGELFAASQSGDILRFTTPLATPTPNGALTGLPVTSPEEIAFVDTELWIPSTSYTSCTTAAGEVTRVAFDQYGSRLNGGFGGDGIYTAGRGVLWDPVGRMFWVSDCHPVDQIYPYKIGADLSVTDGLPTMGGALDNPHGMAMPPWGELFVSNADTNQVLRFTVGTRGALTASGSISGNGLDFPVGLTFAPWGELFVVDQGSGALSRFTFDGAHAASPHGTYATGLSSTASSHDLGWMLLVPGASTAPVTDGGAGGG